MQESPRPDVDPRPRYGGLRGSQADAGRWHPRADDDNWYRSQDDRGRDPGEHGWDRGQADRGRDPGEYAWDPGQGGSRRRAAGPDRGTGDRTGGGQQPQASRWGSLPARRGLVIVLGAAAIGAAGAVVTRQGPGLVLGAFLVVGSVAAAFAVRASAAYRLIPVPVLAYLPAAGAAGLIHDRRVDTSHTALAVSAAQWIASGFLAMTLATILVMAIALIRWLIMRRDPDGPGAYSRPPRAAPPRRRPPGRGELTAPGADYPLARPRSGAPRGRTGVQDG